VNAPSRRGDKSLREVVRETMLECALLMPRPEVTPAAPHDLDAEQGVLSALLCGHTTIDALKPLESSHFYGHFNQRLFNVLCWSPERDLERIADLLNIGGPVIDELTTIRDATPFAVRATLRAHVMTIVDRWRERELIRAMQQIDAELRVGALNHAGARARLREHFVGENK